MSGILILILSFSLAKAQNIYYSSPDEEGNKTSQYEIIGKQKGKVVIYKSNHHSHYISLYDAEMKLIGKIQLPQLPDALSSVNFINYTTGFLMIYQYQKNDFIRLNLLKFNQDIQPIGDPIELDNAIPDNNNETNNYKILVSENKQQIMAFLLTKTDKKTYNYKRVSLNNEGRILNRTHGVLNTNGKNEFFSEFTLDNEGNMAALWETGTSQNDNISSVSIVQQNADSDSLRYAAINFNSISLDDVKLKVDNINHHLLVTSFFSKQRKGNVDGLFCYICDCRTLKTINSINITFADDLRQDAKGNSTTKAAFNDYFLKNIVFYQSGGFLVTSESEYTSSQSNNYYNRWDYLNNSPYWSNYNYDYGISSPSSGYRSNVTRYYADNIVLLSYDEKGRLQWSNTIRKSQSDENNENSISYGILNTGENIEIIYNQIERNENKLSRTTLDSDGRLHNINSVIPNSDKNYLFMPRLSKQVGKKQLIVPCLYGNITCFAKIEY